MLAEVVALHDVHDAEGFCAASLRASGRFYGPEEWEEMLAESVAILFKLARDFEPHRDGYEHAGRFSGFAAKYLRLKSEDAYHRLHAEHQLQTQPDGARRYHYGERAVSLEAITAEDGDRNDVLVGDGDEQSSTPTIRSLLRRHFEERQDIAERVAEKLGEGTTNAADIAEVLWLTSDQVRDALTDLQPIACRLRTLEQR